MTPSRDIFLLKIVLVLLVVLVFLANYRSPWFRPPVVEKYTNQGSPWAQDSWLLGGSAPTPTPTVGATLPVTSSLSSVPAGTPVPTTPQLLLPYDGSMVNPNAAQSPYMNVQHETAMQYEGAYPSAILPATPPVLSSTALVVGSPSNFTPAYDNTINFSRATGYAMTTPVKDSTDRLGGFCAFNRKNPEVLEYQCNQLNADTCASTSCCVLLGGSKCVSGGESGATMKANYTDPLVLNSDHHYYQGKCYGNCVNPQGAIQPLLVGAGVGALPTPTPNGVTVVTPVAVTTTPAPTTQAPMTTTPSPTTPTPTTLTATPVTVTPSLPPSLPPSPTTQVPTTTLTATPVTVTPSPPPSPTIKATPTPTPPITYTSR